MSLDKKLDEDWYKETFKRVDGKIVGSLMGKGLGFFILGSGCEIVTFSLLYKEIDSCFLAIPGVIGVASLIYGSSKIYEAFKMAKEIDQKR